ncbi:MAG TPA: MFS transporter [Methylomirabilota bacterium]|jgi:MFS family permease|nr:MFS transporter [Methylomirabilota bacterium]
MPAVFVHRSFALLWSARVLSTLALHVQAVAVGWQLYALTGSALDLGLVGLAQFVPMFLLALVAGQAADRYDRRRIVIVCQVVKAAAAATLALGTAGGWLSRGSILATMAIVGAARVFETPTLAALVPDVVPRPLITRAAAWSVSANQTARIVGPALGGVLYGLRPTEAYLTIAALVLVAAVCAAAIRVEQAVREREPVTLDALFSGIAFIRRRPVLLGTMSLDLFAVLLGGATALLPIYARDILGTGPAGLGLLRSAPAVGALAMSVFLAQRPLERRVGRALFRAVIIFGAATVVFAVSTNLLLSLAALCVLGASDVVSVVIRFSLVQIRTPDAMRGRVSAVHSLFTGTSNQLGEFESGLAAALFGPVPAVLIGGIGTITVAALWMYLFPELRRIRAFEE